VIDWMVPDGQQPSRKCLTGDIASFVGILQAMIEQKGTNRFTWHPKQPCQICHHHLMVKVDQHLTEVKKEEEIGGWLWWHGEAKKSE
jgi:hypothetical protein